METFNPQKIDPLLINGGLRYENGNVVDAEAINAPIEASAWAQKVAEDAKLLVEAASGIGTEAFFEEIRNIVAPLHKLMIFTDETRPAEIYGGYWMKVKDAFLWCSGDTTSITYTKNGVSVTESLSVGSRGGEISHTLTIDEIPSHKHGYALGKGYSDSASDAYRASTYAATDRRETDYVGGGKSHNIMPQYYAVNAWVRVTEEEFNANEESL